VLRTFCQCRERNRLLPEHRASGLFEFLLKSHGYGVSHSCPPLDDRSRRAHGRRMTDDGSGSVSAAEPAWPAQTSSARF